MLLIFHTFYDCWLKMFCEETVWPSDNLSASHLGFCVKNRKVWGNLNCLLKLHGVYALGSILAFSACKTQMLVGCNDDGGHTVTLSDGVFRARFSRAESWVKPAKSSIQSNGAWGWSQEFGGWQQGGIGVSRVAFTAACTAASLWELCRVLLAL